MNVNNNNCTLPISPKHTNSRIKILYRIRIETGYREKKNEPKKCQDDQRRVSRRLEVLIILFGTIVTKIKNYD